MHISDLHFGPPYRPDIGAAVLRIAPQLRADALVVSGDLTQRAKHDQFASAREFLDQLPAVPTVSFRATTMYLCIAFVSGCFIRTETSANIFRGN